MEIPCLNMQFEQLLRTDRISITANMVIKINEIEDKSQIKAMLRMLSKLQYI